MIPLPFSTAITKAKDKAKNTIDFSSDKFKGTPFYNPKNTDPTEVSWSKEDVSADPFDIDIFLPTKDAANHEGYTEQKFLDAAEVAKAYIQGAVGSWWPVDIEIRDERIPKYADKDGDYWNYITGNDTIDHDFVGLEDPPADDCSIFLAPSPGSFGDYPWCRIGSAQDLAGTEPEYQGGGPKDGDDIDAHKKIETLLHEVGHCMKLEHRDGVDVDGAPTPMNLYSSQGYYSRPGIDYVVYDYAAKCKNEVRNHFE